MIISQSETLIPIVLFLLLCIYVDVSRSSADAISVTRHFASSDPAILRVC